MNLIIVESPTKAKTIGKFLGRGFSVASSYGHVRDLPQKELGVEIENDFKPKYVIPTKARKNIKEIKSLLSKAKETIIATDEDREGEAIAFHLAEVFKLKNPKRIFFHEITKKAVENALKSPREIDANLVNSQQARRILDRLVGYKLSPFLWKKVVRGLSAGRVQSVAVRLIVERENEIKNFKKDEYWTIIASLLKNKGQNLKASAEDGKFPKFEALLIKKDNENISKLGIKNKKEADEIIKDLKGAEYEVLNIEKKEISKNPLPPFTTSVLQQESWQKFRMPAKMTMSLAQSLYEKGLITYHRTDSLNISKSSQEEARQYIEKNYGPEYWPGVSRFYKTKAKSAQEAHEAIRPVYPSKTPKGLKENSEVDERQFKIYDLIWKRFISSQMSSAVFDSSQAEISAKNYSFKASGQTLKFDGFLKAYPMKFEENELPLMEKNEKLELEQILPCQHFTQPPARYTEASLIKILEAEGIGRPSTYAPIIDTIQKRGYVGKNEERRFQPTEIGILVNNLLSEHFPKIVDVKFTARMEEDLDKIALGKKDWVKTLKDFYGPFSENLEKKQKEISKQDLTEKTDKLCPDCGAPVIIRLGRFGKFYACSNFPKCKYTASMEKPKTGVSCPRCASLPAGKQGEIEEKRTRKGKVFYGCSRFPDCDFALWDKPTKEFCPQCNSIIIETKRKQKKCSNKDCKPKI